MRQVQRMAVERCSAALPSELRFRELFPVQAAVWRELAGGLGSAHDLCIAAPTGSGKTLAYVLPVVNGLSRSGPDDDGSLMPDEQADRMQFQGSHISGITRDQNEESERMSHDDRRDSKGGSQHSLRALVVLPTRDLASQARRVRGGGHK